MNEQLESKTYSLNLGYDFKGHAQTEMLITSTGSSLKRPKFHLTRKRRPAFYVTKLLKLQKVCMNLILSCYLNNNFFLCQASKLVVLNVTNTCISWLVYIQLLFSFTLCTTALGPSQKGTWLYYNKLFLL